MSQAKQKKKVTYIWDYFRGGGHNPLSGILNRNSPENLRKKLEALKLQQEIKRQKKQPSERRIES